MTQYCQFAKKTEFVFRHCAPIRIFCRAREFAGCVWWKQINQRVYFLLARRKSAKD
jgi:hypothetical protein